MVGKEQIYNNPCKSQIDPVAVQQGFTCYLPACHTMVGEILSVFYKLLIINRIQNQGPNYSDPDFVTNSLLNKYELHLAPAEDNCSRKGRKPGETFVSGTSSCPNSTKTPDFVLSGSGTGEYLSREAAKAPVRRVPERQRDVARHRSSGAARVLQAKRSRFRQSP